MNTIGDGNRGRGRGRPRGRASARSRSRARGVSARALNLDLTPDDLPPPRPTMEVEIKKIKKNPIKRLSEEQRKELLKRREQKEIASFLMPDAPPRKIRKNEVSPERVPCPLLPGTPEIPPPRIPQAWEKHQDMLDDIPLSPRIANVRPIPILMPSTGVSQMSDLGGVQICEADIELCGDWPESSRGSVSPLPVSPLPVSPLPVSPLPLSPLPVSPLPVSPVPGSSSSMQRTPSPAHIQADPQPSTSRAKPRLQTFNDDSIALELALRDADSDVELDDEDVATQGISFLRDCPAELEPEVMEQLQILDSCDDSALQGMASDDMLDFSWSSDPTVFTGQREVYTGQSGPTFDVQGMTPLDVLCKMFDADLITLIIEQTNAYGEQLKNDPRNRKFSEFKRWTPITEGELWVFLGIIMIQSLVQVPVEAEYWRPKERFTKVGHFEDMMSLHRFRLIKRCLHFVDNTALSTNAPKRKAAKILPVVDHLNAKFSSLYLPGQEIAIDESLLLWKGRLSFAQMINSKAARVGIKSYELCESKTGYLWKMSLYDGKKFRSETVEGHHVQEDEPEGATSQVVFDLVRPLLHRGHTLVMDNFYNSPLLSRTLKLRQTDTMGTLRLNRQFVPESLKGKTKNNMRTGEICFSQTRDMTVVVWKDSNVVSLISTYHGVGVGGKEKYGYYRYRPQVVLDYNLSMGGVDKKDQLLQAYPMERTRNAIWYKKLFRRLLNVSIMNAHIIFGTKTKMAARDFRFQLVTEIFWKFRPLAMKPVPVTVSLGHFPVKTGKRKSRCKLCARNKKDVCTVWKCEMCQVNLCLPDCFKTFHFNHL